MRVWAIRGGAALLVLVVVFLAGRYSAPTKVTEDTTKKTVATSTTTSTEAKNLATDEVVDRRTTTRRAPARPAAPAPASGVCPECPVVDEMVVEERITKKILDQGKIAAASVARAETTEHTTKVTETARPGLGVALLAGWRPDAGSPAPSVYQLQVDKRIVGTVWLGAWLQGENVPDQLEKRGGWKLNAVGLLARLEL